MYPVIEKKVGSSTGIWPVAEFPIWGVLTVTPMRRPDRPFLNQPRMSSTLRWACSSSLMVQADAKRIFLQTISHWRTLQAPPRQGMRRPKCMYMSLFALRMAWSGGTTLSWGLDCRMIFPVLTCWPGTWRTQAVAYQPSQGVTCHVNAKEHRGLLHDRQCWGRC